MEKSDGSIRGEIKGENSRDAVETAKEEELEIFRESLQDTEAHPSWLEQIAVGVESHVEVLSDEIEKETNTAVRKNKRKRRSQWKKSLKRSVKISCHDSPNTKPRTTH
jgi:hypothetical protein